MAAYHDRRTMERMRAQSARADRELGTARHFFDPGSAEGVEMDLIHAANARVALGDTLETVRLERVMNLGENRIDMRIPRSPWFPCDLRFPHS
jgi:hypothetical protein